MRFKMVLTDLSFYPQTNKSKCIWDLGQGRHSTPDSGGRTEKAAGLAANKCVTQFLWKCHMRFHELIWLWEAHEQVALAFKGQLKHPPNCRNL